MLLVLEEGGGKGFVETGTLPVLARFFGLVGWFSCRTGVLIKIIVVGERIHA